MLRIKELREYFGLSQEKLAKEIMTSQKNISRWESGENEPAYSFILKLADYFNVSLDYLVGRSEDTAPQFTATVKADAEETKLLKLFNTLSPNGKKLLISQAENIKKYDKADVSVKNLG